MKTFFLIIIFFACQGHAESQKLFNGRDLTGWMAIPFTNGGEIRVLERGVIECDVGNPLSGIVYTNTPPSMNYELSLEAMRIEGADFFIALTIPIENSHCTVIIGGWSGSLCGVSSIDNCDAGLNQWSKEVQLKSNIWYKLRVRVTPGLLLVFLNEDLYTARIEYKDPSRLSLRPGGELALTKPLGVATYYTKALWRNFTLTPINELEPSAKTQNN